MDFIFVCGFKVWSLIVCLFNCKLLFIGLIYLYCLCVLSYRFQFTGILSINLKDQFVGLSYCGLSSLPCMSDNSGSHSICHFLSAVVLPLPPLLLLILLITHSF